MIITEWKDFVLSRSPEITNQTQRFNLLLSDRRVTRDILETEGERFEAMKISQDGSVTVWTTGKVWFIIKHGELEKLIYGKCRASLLTLLMVFASIRVSCEASSSKCRSSLLTQSARCESFGPCHANCVLNIRGRFTT